MRSFGVIAIEIMGGVALAICGSMLFLGTITPVDLSSNQLVTHKPVIQTAESDTASCNGLTPTTDAVTDSPSSQEIVMKSTAESTLRYKVALLAEGTHFLRGIPSYTANLRKQEVVKGELLAEQTMSMKFRQKPFSVYLKWLKGDVGREVIYVEGSNNGKMFAHDGGWMSHIPAFSLSPDCALAMHDERYPITTAGLNGLIEMMVDVHQNDLIRANFASCELDSNERFDGRPCYLFTTKYKSAKDSPIYRKSITFIDQEWKVPLQSRHFEWPRAGTVSAEAEVDEATLIESYSYTQIQMRSHLTDHDFERTNQEYHFR